MEFLLLLIVGVFLFSGAGLIAAQTFEKIKRTRNRVWLGVFLMIAGIVVNLILAYTILYSGIIH